MVKKIKNSKLHLAKVQKIFSVQIFSFSLGLLALTTIYYLLDGFDPTEFASTMALLSAITSVYFGALIRFLAKDINQDKKDYNKLLNKVPKITLWIVPLHFILLTIIISLKAFTYITYSEMNIFFVVIEGILGGSTSYLLVSVFQIKSEIISKNE